MSKSISLPTKLLIGFFCIANTQTFTLPSFSSVATTSYNKYKYIKSFINPWSLAAQCICINALKNIANYKDTQMLHRRIQRGKIEEVRCPEYLKDTVKKMGFQPDDITFYLCNSDIMPLFAKCNEFAIFANNSLMEQLNEKEQQAFIAHELAHIKNDDSLKRDLFLNISTIAIPIALHLLDKCLQVTFNKIDVLNGIQKYSAFITHSQLVAIALQVYLFFKFSQYQEYQADITAVKKLGTSQPLINAFTRISQQEKLRPKQARISIPNKILNFFAKFLHPTLEKRIAYLRSLE